MRQDLYIAMMALKAAQEKMHLLDKTLNSDALRNASFSAA